MDTILINDEEKKLPQLLEDLIVLIFIEELQIGAARASTIATKAKISRSNLTNSLKILKKQDYIIYEPYSLIYLTEKGKAFAYDITHRRNVIKAFFMNLLKITDEEAEKVACDLEHVLSPMITKKMGQYILYATETKEDLGAWIEKYQKSKPKSR